MAGLKKIAKKQAAAHGCPQPCGEPLRKQLNRASSVGARWTFAFRFFKQIEFFSLDSPKIDSTWLVSVIERLRDMGGQEIDAVLRNSAEAKRLRLHKINWSQTNIPIQRKELDWLHPDYLSNEDEYPLLQFMVSQGKGRIIGFFDEQNVFQIILLDPLHNMQPSKSFGYSVDPCSPLACQFTRLHDSVKDALKRGQCCQCGVIDAVEAVLAENGNSDEYDVIVMRVADATGLQDAHDLIKGGAAESYTEIFQLGLDALVNKI